MAQVLKISAHLANPARDFVYDLLPHLPLRFAVDIGAAAGECTRRIRLAGGPDLAVVGIEPFPGNFKFFEEATHDLETLAS